eukprot:CAMPEP_0177680574 /NCGR_PEP_ID=MMETSP0447-20121125/30247_1 /TAXON_ID=0 /ORGANISM="Stygamoeba regulata, Strain BSH-02190019" /LENGTH=325 /DNA_ID=CAMNT_0019189917 /DNA_START=163 /DNA_END=1140 /DNA_ORIENTATION=-
MLSGSAAALTCQGSLSPRKAEHEQAREPGHEQAREPGHEQAREPGHEQAREPGHEQATGHDDGDDVLSAGMEEVKGRHIAFRFEDTDEKTLEKGECDLPSVVSLVSSPQARRIEKRKRRKLAKQQRRRRTRGESLAGDLFRLQASNVDQDDEEVEVDVDDENEHESSPIKEEEEDDDELIPEGALPLRSVADCSANTTILFRVLELDEKLLQPVIGKLKVSCRLSFHRERIAREKRERGLIILSITHSLTFSFFHYKRYRVLEVNTEEDNLLVERVRPCDVSASEAISTTTEPSVEPQNQGTEQNRWIRLDEMTEPLVIQLADDS